MYAMCSFIPPPHGLVLCRLFFLCVVAWKATVLPSCVLLLLLLLYWCGVAKCRQLMSLQQPLMISILSRATQNYNPLYSSLKDQFELCLTKCRTSSKARLTRELFMGVTILSIYATKRWSIELDLLVTCILDCTSLGFDRWQMSLNWTH